MFPAAVDEDEEVNPGRHGKRLALDSIPLRDSGLFPCQLQAGRMTSVYVAAVDGTECWMPLPARHLHDDLYELLPNDEFDPEDRSLLLEFLPGDVVRCSNVEGRPTANSLATSVNPDREYWSLLFDLVVGKAVPSQQISHQLFDRIRVEVQEGGCWHYAQVARWVEKVAAGEE